MKVNLLLDNPDGVLGGYVNIDQFTPPDDTTGRIGGEVGDLSHTVDAAEAEEIVALEILDFFPAKRTDHVLDNWLSRLAHGGTITVSVVDTREVARGVLNRQLTMETLNGLLYGEQKRPWEFRKAAYTMEQLVEVFRGKGLKILQKRLVNFRAYVTAQRP